MIILIFSIKAVKICYFKKLELREIVTGLETIASDKRAGVQA